MHSHISLPLLLVSAVAVLAVPAPTAAPIPAIPTLITAPSPVPTTGSSGPTKSLETRDFEPSLDLPTISIEPFTLSSLDLNLPSNTCTPTVSPDANGYVPPDQCNALYNYYPSFAAAVAFSVLFGILMIAHFIQATTYKAGFVWVILMGAVWECSGYAARAVSTKDQQDTTVLTITELFILLAPILVNAFDYMVLARMINFFVPERQIGIFKPSLLAFVFVFLDIASFVIQLIGGGMATPSADAATQLKGIHIYMGGIGIQQFFITLFLIIAVHFHRHASSTHSVSLLFITIRIIFRLVEFSSGNDDSNPMTHNEWYMYVFDAAPMWCAIAVWNVIHPGAVIKGPDAVMPPSPLGKLFCCTCCRKRRNKDMQKIPGEDPSGGDEMLLLNLRPASPYR
ncbi:RTA1 like protein-domain-containing protein [Aspergillus spinulosporus]